jgi:hypothetical protein
VHGSIDVPFALLNGLFSEQLRGMKPVPVNLPGLGTYQKQIGQVAIAPRSVRIKPGKPGQVHFDLDFNVLHRGKALFTMSTAAAVTPQVKDGKLLIPIGPEALRKIEPRLGPAAATNLTRAIHQRLPKAARMMISTKVLKRASNEALARLVDGGYALLRDSVVAEMAPRTQVAIGLPDLPIDGVHIRSKKTWLAIGLKTRMSVEGVLPKARTAPPKNRLRVRMLGGMVAALGNRAIVKGELPQRINSKGKPAKDGAFRPGLGWESGDRPAKIWLWREQDTCMRAQVGGTPELSAQLNKKREHTLQVQVADGTVEDVEGPMLITMGAWIQSLWADAIRISKSVVAQTRLEVGERVVEVAVQRAKVDADVVELGLSAMHR